MEGERAGGSRVERETFGLWSREKWKARRRPAMRWEGRPGFEIDLLRSKNSLSDAS